METVYDRIRKRISWKTRLKVWVKMRMLLIEYKVNKMKIDWFRMLVLVLIGYAIMAGLDASDIYIHPMIEYPLIVVILYLLQGDTPIITNKDQDE